MVFTSDFEEYVNNLVFDYISNNLKKTMETNNHISSSPLSKKVRLESPSQTIPSTSGSSDLENKDIIHSTNEFKIVQHFLKNLLSSCCEIFISKDKLISLFRPITIGDQEIK